MLSDLAADRARVAESNAQILLLERSLSALRSQSRVQDPLDSYKYPVLTLPNEIVAEIFTHYIPIYPWGPRTPFTGPETESPTLLTQICRKWRGIALETANLWRAISLPDLNLSETKQAALSDAWLSRSRACPISFWYSTPADFPSYGAEILSVLIKHRARLEHLSLNGISRTHLPAIEGPMPLLRRFELLLEDLDDFHDDSAIEVSFLEAPLLRKVLLSGAIGVDNIVLPWAQLTSLALLGRLPHDCAPILRHTSNLVHCELALVRDPLNEAVPHVTLPSLQSLMLTSVMEDDNSITGFLQTLTTPILRRLRVPEAFLGPNFIDTLKSFVSRSGCKLQDLCVTERRIESKSSYRIAFPSTNVSFGHWATASDEWLMFGVRDCPLPLELYESSGVYPFHT
ncbi:F-box domain-containing protein [Mycena sanguinolenta]|uniref:F-box domain-containing protein n=1 Tax=Mycena sanguinolenta TaxID=230812 RepID=A0A8H7DAR1_9AGAR|nr:F-box domain-containing protein [Mycena sanguinolenta]